MAIRPEDCRHANTMPSRNIHRTLVCLDCGQRDPFAEGVRLNGYPGLCERTGQTTRMAGRCGACPPCENQRLHGHLPRVQELIQQIRALGLDPVAHRSPMGNASLAVSGMHAGMRQRLAQEYPDIVTGGGHPGHMPMTQYIEVRARIDQLESLLAS